MIKVVKKTHEITLNDFTSISELCSDKEAKDLIIRSSEVSIILADGVVLHGEQYISDGFLIDGIFSHHDLLISRNIFDSGVDNEIPRFYINDGRLWAGSILYGMFLYSKENPFVVKVDNKLSAELNLDFTISRSVQGNLSSAEFNIEHSVISI